MRHFHTKKFFALPIAFGFLAHYFFPNTAAADPRNFTYVYESRTEDEGELEFEQWVTNQHGRKDQDYSAWNFRTELEYGITDNLTTSLYVNFDSVRAEFDDGTNDNETKFKGLSSEWVYQVLDRNKSPLGLAIYGELTSDGIDSELETKLIVDKRFGGVLLAANATYEAEWERENRRTEKEATLDFSFGAAYSINDTWSVGLEARNESAYPDGLDLNGQEFQAWSAGPNVRYQAREWWATLTILPQVWGNGEDSSGSRQLVHSEELEVRLLVGHNID